MEELEFTSENLKMLCEKYPDVRITREDSYRAGNCEEGTEEFAETHFPGREKITIRELARFASGNHFVRVVLWNVLIPKAQADGEHELARCLQLC